MIHPRRRTRDDDDDGGDAMHGLRRPHHRNPRRPHHRNPRRPHHRNPRARRSRPSDACGRARRVADDGGDHRHHDPHHHRFRHHRRVRRSRLECQNPWRHRRWASRHDGRDDARWVHLHHRLPGLGELEITVRRRRAWAPAPPAWRHRLRPRTHPWQRQLCSKFCGRSMWWPCAHPSWQRPERAHRWQPRRKTLLTLRRLCGWTCAPACLLYLT